LVARRRALLAFAAIPPLAASLGLAHPLEPREAKVPAAPASARPPSGLALDAAIDRGLRFLAGSWKGDRFDDAYLDYVYPGEHLACPLPDCRVTYRLLDAYFDLRWLKGALGTLGPAEPIAVRATEVTRALVVPWRQSGPYNVRRDPVADGIGLDTYCILGLVERDRAMAEVVARHLDGTGWIPEGYYRTSESFRALADETWCARLLAVTGTAPDRVPRLAAAEVERGRVEVESARSREVAANLAYHLLNLLSDVRREELAPAAAWFESRLADAVRDPALSDDRLTRANLLEGLATARRERRADLDALAADLLAAQEEDGGWHSRRGETGTSLRTFTTLRALLALARYRAL
jgi:hypothetical protein